MHGKDVITDNSISLNLHITKTSVYELILNDFKNIFNNNIPYGIYFIYHIRDIYYLITTTDNNDVIILKKSIDLEGLFSEQVINKNLMDFYPLSEQSIKYIYYNNEITGVVYGIGKI